MQRVHDLHDGGTEAHAHGQRADWSRLRTGESDECEEAHVVSVARRQRQVKVA